LSRSRRIPHAAAAAAVDVVLPPEDEGQHYGDL
jgi:hypothetical protein